MLTYARMGRRNEALNQYLLLRKALREELRANPLPETHELFRRIQMGQVIVDLTEAVRGSGPLSPVPSSVQDARPPSDAQAHEFGESSAVETGLLSTSIPLVRGLLVVVYALWVMAVRRQKAARTEFEALQTEQNNAAALEVWHEGMCPVCLAFCTASQLRSLTTDQTLL